MEKEVIDTTDYANWLDWVFCVERRRQTKFEFIKFEEIPILLQIHETEGDNIHNNSNDKLTSSNSEEISTRWKEIC
jgi:hypothetical protein